MGGSLIIGNETLVRVDQRIGNDGHSAGVFEKPGDVAQSQVAQPVFGLRIVKGILAAPVERLIHVHA